MTEAGSWEQSIRLLSQAEAWDALAGLIRSQAPGLAAQGRFNTLADWLNHLPPDVLEKDPWLLLWAGISRLNGRPREGQELCVQAFEGFKAVDDLQG
jgi:ATP/maltotriose-dependent transcriptional regulator MalT